MKQKFIQNVIVASYLKTTSRFYLEGAYLKKLVKNMLGSSFSSFYIYQVIHIRDDVYMKIFEKGITLENLYEGINLLDSMMKVFTQIIKQLSCQVARLVILSLIM